MTRECPPYHCPSLKGTNLKYCENTTLQTKLFPKTALFLTSHQGYGLKAMETIPVNTIIMEYIGEIITQEEGCFRMQQYSLADSFYFASLGTTTTTTNESSTSSSTLLLDAKHQGSMARFINHSCQPNCVLQ